MPFGDYQKAPGINASLLKIVWQKSLAHARAHLDGIYQPESDALAFGKCFHALCLENRELFVEKPATYTDGKGIVKPWNGNAHACQDWLEACGESIPLDADDVRAARAMAVAVRSMPELDGLFVGRAEMAVFGQYKGAAVKIMVDLLPERKDAPVIDLKTCRNAEPEAFLRDAVRMGYHLQAAFYLDVLRWAGITRPALWFVAVETDPPHAASVIRFTDDDCSFIHAGRALYRAAFQRIVDAQQTGRWEGYGAHDAEIVAPRWMQSILDPS